MSLSPIYTYRLSVTEGRTSKDHLLAEVIAAARNDLLPYSSRASAVRGGNRAVSRACRARPEYSGLSLGIEVIAVTGYISS